MRVCFSRWFWKKNHNYCNSYLIFFLMFICQNVGNLKGFLLVYLHGLYLSHYQVTAPPAEAPHIRTIKKKKSNTCLFNCLSGVLVEGPQSSGITTGNSHI